MSHVHAAQEKNINIAAAGSKPILFFFLSVLLYPLIFPKFNLPILSFIALIPLIIASLKADKLITSFKNGWIYGTVANIIIYYWIYLTLKWNGAGIIASFFGLLLLSVYVGLYWGIFALSVNSIKNTDPISKPLLIASFWVILEFFRSYLLTGLPWLLLGHSFWQYPVFNQIASITGVYGISFIIIFFNSAAAALIIDKKKLPVIIASVLILITLIYGISIRKEYKTSEKLNISVLQGNIHQYKKWDREYSDEITGIFSRIHEKAVSAENQPDLIIWPETSLPSPLTSSVSMMAYVNELTSNTDAYELIGSAEYARGGYYNSAYVISPDNVMSEPYRKIHLVPFGEYIPFRSVLSRFIGVVNEVGDFLPGEDYKLFDIKGFNVAVGICFEDIFPDIIRRFVKNGADIFVNITNDGWYLKTAGGYQHFMHIPFRAIETRRYVVRAANTGISAVVTPYGDILKPTNLMEEAVLDGDIYKNNELTFYTKHGDIFTIFLFLFTICFIWIIRSKDLCLMILKKKPRN